MSKKPPKKIPEKWQKNAKVVKAMQVAFDVEAEISCSIRVEAAQSGLTPSEQMRKDLGLPYSSPKRPRLSISMKPEDYEILAKRYNVNPEDTLEIKRQMMEELIKLRSK